MKSSQISYVYEIQCASKYNKLVALNFFSLWFLQKKSVQLGLLVTFHFKLFELLIAYSFNQWTVFLDKIGNYLNKNDSKDYRNF